MYKNYEDVSYLAKQCEKTQNELLQFKEDVKNILTKLHVAAPSVVPAILWDTVTDIRPDEAYCVIKYTKDIKIISGNANLSNDSCPDNVLQDKVTRVDVLPDYIRESHTMKVPRQLLEPDNLELNKQLLKKRGKELVDFGVIDTNFSWNSSIRMNKNLSIGDNLNCMAKSFLIQNTCQDISNAEYDIRPEISPLFYIDGFSTVPLAEVCEQFKHELGQWKCRWGYIFSTPEVASIDEEATERNLEYMKDTCEGLKEMNETLFNFIFICEDERVAEYVDEFFISLLKEVTHDITLVTDGLDMIFLRCAEEALKKAIESSKIK